MQYETPRLRVIGTFRALTRIGLGANGDALTVSSTCGGSEVVLSCSPRS